MLIGTLGGLGILYFVSLGEQKEEKFEELALGSENTSVYAQVDGVVVHCGDLEDARYCVQGYKQLSPEDKLVLWLGNSQLHAINQLREGDKNSTAIIHRLLRSDAKYLITFSQPNANLQEHYLLFEYLLSKLPVSTLILPLVFDDMRETGIRTSLAAAFSQPAVANQLKQSAIGKQLLARHRDQDINGKDLAALNKTPQEQSENYLNVQLASAWQIWADRPMLRGEFITSLYLFRNWILGITPSSTRKMIPGVYTLNRQALEAILATAVESRIDVLLYVVPLRNDVKPPYDLSQYADFKIDIQSIADRFGVRFVNLESIVPPEYWGTKDSTTLGEGQEVDFMHFRAGGHQLLAHALYEELKALWGKR